MPNGQIPQPDIEMLDVKKELEQQRNKLHNMRINIQIQEVVVKKFEELSR